MFHFKWNENTLRHLALGNSTGVILTHSAKERVLITGILGKLRSSKFNIDLLAIGAYRQANGRMPTPAGLKDYSKSEDLMVPLISKVFEALSSCVTPEHLQSIQTKQQLQQGSVAAVVNEPPDISGAPAVRLPLEEQPAPIEPTRGRHVLKRKAAEPDCSAKCAEGWQARQYSGGSPLCKTQPSFQFLTIAEHGHTCSA
jgi:hypothetical protein